MFDLKKSFGFDKSLAETGAKKLLGPDPDSDYITLKRIPNPEYRSLLAKEYRSNASILEAADDETKNRISDLIMSKVLATTVVVGWGPGVTEDGKPVKFSTEACIDLFMKYPEFRTSCASWAEDNSNFKETPEVSVAAAKKS